MKLLMGFDVYNMASTGDVSKTLNSIRSDSDHTPVVCYGISAYNSNCMKSSNPHSGIYEAKTSRTLDLNGGNPACNQGGMMVVIALEGNGSRPSHAGNGYSESKTMYTLNTIEQHAVCYSVENHPNDSRVRIRDDGTVQTLSARCGTGGGNTPCALICCDAVRRIQGNAPDPESVRRRSRGGV